MDLTILNGVVRKVTEIFYLHWHLTIIQIHCVSGLQQSEENNYNEAGDVQVRSLTQFYSVDFS